MEKKLDLLETLIKEIKKKYLIKDVDKLIISLSDGGCEEKNDDLLNNLFEIAVLANSRKNYQQSLEILTLLLNEGFKKDEIINFIVKIYYEPFKDYFKDNFEKNIQVLKNYFGISMKKNSDFSELKLKFLSYNNNHKIFNYKYFLLDGRDESFDSGYTVKINSDKLNSSNLEGAVLIFNEVYDVNFILSMLEKTSHQSIMWEKRPLYLYYSDYDEFIEHLQVCDFTRVLKFERIQFLFGQQELNEYFINPQSYIPSMIFNSPVRKFSDVGICLDRIFLIRNNAKVTAKKEMISYYKGFNPSSIEEKYKNGTLKIGFFTSRFTTALKFYTRDCIMACQNLGVKADVLIEQSDISWSASEECFNHFINSFKPDIIFVIDHFRWEYPSIPENIPYVCWVQDFMPSLFSAEAAKKVGRYDFVMNIFMTSEEFNSFGYPEKHLIDGPIMSNPQIYKKYELTEDEIEKYCADICIISNAGYIEDALEMLFSVYRNSIPDHIKKALRSITNIIYDDVYFEKKHYFKVSDIKGAFLDFFSKKQISIEESILNQLIENYRIHVLLNIYKTVPVMWLHEKGYNMKIWGKTWVNHPVLKKYAMGVAANGETMSRILNATKISVGINMIVSLHPRVYEATLSGCLYIGNGIPEEHDFCNIRRYMSENDEILFFYSKEDLYKKIDRFLADESARNQIVEKGADKIKKVLTYEILMDNMIKKICEHFPAGSK